MVAFFAKLKTYKMNSVIIFTKNQIYKDRERKLTGSLLKMKFYLRELGYNLDSLKKPVVTKIYAKERYSETITIGIDEWILSKVACGDFEGMKTRRKLNKAKVKPMKYTQFLKSKYWADVRKSVLKRDCNRCTKCGSTKYLHVHYLTYVNHFREHSNIKDLIVLCKDCHKLAHIEIDKKKAELNKTIENFR